MNEITLLITEEAYDAMREWLEDCDVDCDRWSNHKVLRVINNIHKGGIVGFMRKMSASM